MIKKIFLKIISIIFLLIITQSQLFAVNNSLNEKQLIDKTREISQNIRCLVCQNQSIDESNSELAKDLRVLIKEKVSKGFNNKEIYNYLSRRYGDYILLNPPLKTNTILLWFLPFLILILGTILMLKFIKK
ncbi:cytochrome c-type biogenesis protein CcmH [Alphaproteobacteria bacterium]|jgi:cytochrome c-type biogenesis protein CcmH|nr:cytochrome c-type biogenesis protein CcmH [Alphaproteobacteria bacterium]|tara:strand:+ start:987 stop:1379 length:393 start_codon:yes stop_codon:yes gene_type:complete